MRPVILLALVVTAAACSSTEPHETTGSSEHTGAGGDTADTGPDDDTGSDTTSLTLAYDSDASGLAVAFVGPYDGQDVPSDVWLAFAAAGTSQTTTLPAPPDSAIGPVDMVGGAEAAVYYLAMFDDTDTGATHDPGEAWVGVAGLAIFMADPVPDELAARGLTVGWNVLGYPSGTLYPLSAVPMSLHRPQNDITVGGTVEGLRGEGDPALVLFPYGVGAEATPLHDALLEGDAWTLTLTGEPPADHHHPNAPEFAFEQPLAYLDRAPSGFDSGDRAYSYACYRASAVYLQWYETDDFGAAFTPLMGGMGAGWTATFSDGGTLRPIEPGAIMSLVADGSCS